MKRFCKAQILEMAEKDIFCVKLVDNDDSANGSWMLSVFVEIYAFHCPKLALKNVLQNANFQVLFATRLRANGDCKVTETHLKERRRSNGVRKMPDSYKLSCLRNVVATFLNMTNR